MARIALFLPNTFKVNAVIDLANPDMAMTLPNIAPKRKTAKYSLIKSTIRSIKTPEKKGMTNSGAVKKTAKRAAIGANKITLYPLYATKIKKDRENKIMTISIMKFPTKV
ncbi:hypothetical protein [Cognataquiflexum rubidum]|uniref:hypothetical protein n=1 Tax=Cognataquiflexum rubidum TaxID=2922273 RepID=UPI001F1364FC|nr:hypothetical protein [Cognataquiflexum rubidum]MCH6233158.1 hypothetical protein [Cognataquiflexum rubidum]